MRVDVHVTYGFPSHSNLHLSTPLEVADFLEGEEHLGASQISILFSRRKSIGFLHNHNYFVERYVV